jgi:hypothetical protein
VLFCLQAPPSLDRLNFDKGLEVVILAENGTIGPAPVNWRSPRVLNQREKGMFGMVARVCGQWFAERHSRRGYLLCQRFRKVPNTISEPWIPSQA